MIKKFSVLINKKIKRFSKVITVESDKSISHRSLLVASQCIGVSNIQDLLESEDVKNTIICLERLGVKIKKKIINILFMEMVLLHLENQKIINFMQEIQELWLECFLLYWEPNQILKLKYLEIVV